MYSRVHVEQHFTGSDTVRDIVIGMSDGLTVPFALAAGLSGAVDSSFVVLIAGIAEVVAGSIAMGLGGYLAARSEADHYQAELEREWREVKELPQAETEEVRQVFRGYGLEGEPLEQATQAVIARPQTWVDFMMKEELGLEEPDPRRALCSALTIGGSYVAGGAIPLLPYALRLPLASALVWSVVVTLVALLIFGTVKARFTGISLFRGAWQTALVGGLAAGAAYGLARLISGLEH
ncbi:MULTISPECIES: VIT1/CCC1 transporter family protein [unclassified Meiothermus]|uniref:VIT1/CCC1 transporter family protein n=1 Tax=unclassified Meiothermus TaxID=370471 RepID=UPI000D7C52A8|nr:MULTISPECIES: VIT1/CCC1 transporter family protein [unclassified Meiothermus]PZA06126.1 iron transporter [Meiothermus sp. Pnk-1]RYM35400.1 iron transporter [Meiothermus sp. PNK-Is4]